MIQPFPLGQSRVRGQALLRLHHERVLLRAELLDDRREWISSTTLYLYYTQDTQQPRQFLLRARNNNLEAWRTLKTVTDMAWSLKGEHKKLWVENSKPYNQYRFENIGTGDESSCA